MNCRNCGVETSNPSFCSRSCAATLTNKTPKRKGRVWLCGDCGCQVPERRKFCRNCHPFFVDWSTVTLAQMRARALYQHSARIRGIARSIYRQSDKPKRCAICGYDRHYEICHVRAINEFSDETPIATINALSNLVALCPNHHWELDNGYLDLVPTEGLEPPA